jgi:nitroreductase
MEVFDAIKGRRSVRNFTDEPVKRDVLERLIEAGVWAPSGGNWQTWRFVVVTEESILKKIKMVSPGLLGEAPALIAICQDIEEARTRGGRLGAESVCLMDTAMSAQNMMLAGHALGLGTCPIASFHQEAVQRILGLPEKIVPQLLVSVGHPKKTPNPPKRRTEGICFFEGYHGKDKDRRKGV